jgi:hypothetical protein
MSTQRFKPSGVRSEPLHPATRTPHVLPRSAVIVATITMLRIVALALIVASTFGNYVQFAGGWPAPGGVLPLDWLIIGAAVAYQLICSVFQWGFKALRWWLPYAVALIASAIPSFLTYNAWAGPYLSAQLGSIIAGVLILAATIGADALPEWVLVG